LTPRGKGPAPCVAYQARLRGSTPAALAILKKRRGGADLSIFSGPAEPPTVCTRESLRRCQAKGGANEKDTRTHRSRGGNGAGRSLSDCVREWGSSQAGFVNVRRGQEVRFLGTNVACFEPKRQVAGGQVGCEVSYAHWRNILHPVPMQYDVGLTLSRCIDISR
jgi:hypothetical protein